MFIYPGIFAGRRYANAVYAVVVCPSISSTVFTRCNRRNDGRRNRWCDRSHVCLDEATVGVIIGAIRHKSQPDILSKRPDELSWFLARRLPSIYPTLFFKGNLGTSKNKSTSLCNFVPNCGLRKFRHG